MLGLFAMLTVAARAAGRGDASWDRIRYIGGALSARVSLGDPEDSVTLSSDRLIIRLFDGQTLEIPTAAVTFLGYTREAIPDDGVIGLPAVGAPIPIFYMGWVKKVGLHYVAIEYTRTEGGSARVLLQADKKNYVPMLTALSASTGVRVSMPAADRKHFPKKLATQELDQPLRRVPGVAVWGVESLAGHRKGVTSVGFSPDGRLLASASHDGAIVVWDVTGRKIAWQPPKQGREATEITFGPANLLASWHMYKDSVTVWDVGTHAVVADIPGPKGIRIRHAAFSPDGQMLAILEEDINVSDVVRVWRLADLQDLGEFRPEKAETVRGSLLFSADGATLTHWSRRGPVNAWDIPSGRRTRITGTAVANAIALDSSARWLAAARSNQTLELWDVRLGNTAGEFTGHFGRVNAAGFSADARRLASIAQGHALVWDVTTHQAIGQCSWGSSGARSTVALSPDGTLAAMSSWDDPGIGICSAPNR